MVMIVVAVAVWSFCGVISYGIAFAHFQREFPTTARENRLNDRIFAAFLACLGPLGLVPALLACRAKHGLKY